MQGGFYPQVIERALDRIVYQTQQIAEKLGRAITLSASSALSGLFLPDPESGKYLRGRADGTGYENVDLTSSGSIGIPVSIAQGGTGRTTLAAHATDVSTQLRLGTAAVKNAGILADQVLVLPTNGTLPAVDGSAVTHTGRLLARIFYSAAGVFTYTKNPAAVRVRFKALGGGAAGGGVAATASAPNTSAGAGGGAGGYAEKDVLNSSLATNTTITIGAGGSPAGGAAPGGNGGTTSVGLIVTATGGGGGVGCPAQAGTGFVTGPSGGGIGSNGDINLGGGQGGPGFVASGAPMSGKGGASEFGDGALPVAAAAGNNAVNPGSGGSGASNQASSGARAGGAGAPGMVIVEEYDA